MTHSLHREGSPDDFYDDFTIICMAAKGYNDKGSQDKLRRFLRLAMKHNAVNFGNMEAGSALVGNPEDIIEAVHDATTVQATFASEDDLVHILQDLHAEDLGMSIVVQGLIEKVEECCQKADLVPHTWNHSLGVWGKKEKLPPQDIREITTMCGHGMVSVSLVNKMVSDICKGKIDYQKAAKILAKPCICGFINPVRAERILKRMVEKI